MPWHKHERGWENLRQLCKSETKSRVCLTVENSPNASSVYIRLCKHRKKFFYCFCKITFPRKESKTLCMAMIKREILTSRKILSTKSCTRNQFLFCKKMLCKIRILLAWNVSLSKEKLTQIGGGWGVWERHSQNVKFMGGKRRWNTLIYPRQFGFRKPISTQTPLLYRLLTKSFSI